MTPKRNLKMWKKIVSIILVWAERKTKSLRASQYNGNTSIPWSDPQEPRSSTLCRWKKPVIQRPHPSSACILLSFVAKNQKDFFAVLAREKDLFYSLMLPYWKGQSSLPLQAGKYEGSAMVFLNVILFPAQLCKLAVLPSLPSFLYTHSHVWRNINHG